MSVRRIWPSPTDDELTPVEIEQAYAIESPSLRGNFVTSLDGVTELGGVSAPLNGPADQDVFATLRALADVILVGGATVRAEGYGPAFLREDRRRRRLARGQSAMPAMAVVTGAVDLDLSGRFFAERKPGHPTPPKPFVFTSAPLEAGQRSRLDQLAELVVLPDVGGGRVDLRLVLVHLQGLGLGRVLCEGGPSTWRQLVADGLVDELCLTHSPRLAGPGHDVLAGDPGGQAWAGPWPCTATEVLMGDGMFMVRYRADHR